MMARGFYFLPADLYKSDVKRFIPEGEKPLPVGYKKAAAKLGVPKNEICTIGDQLFTDILGAKLFGIKSILVPPIEPEKTAFFKIKRAAEKPFLPKKYL